MSHLYKKIVQSLFIAGLTVFVAWLNPVGIVAMLCISVLLLSVMFALYHSLLLFRSLPSKVPDKNFYIGAFLVLGGTLSDLIATIPKKLQNA